MRTPRYRAVNLPRVVAGIPRCPVYAELAPVTVSVSAIQSPPMPLFSEGPAFGFGMGDRFLNLLVGVA